VPTAKLLLLRYLFRGEHRQGSVGGARHGISQIGTGGLERLVALGHKLLRKALGPEERGIGGSRGI
jgi:hypothetical protein